MAERKPRQPRTRSSEPARRRQKTESKKAADRMANPEARLLELSEELFKLRFQFATRQLTNTARIRTVRKDIARAKTIQRQRELVGNA